MSGLRPEDIQFSEVHDCFSIAEIVHVEDLGFFKPGEGYKAIEDGATISTRVTVVAHMRELEQGVRIEHDAFIGPGAIILPNVTVGHGAVVTAGSVVTRSVPPMTVVQGNPAVPVAKCGIPLTPETSMKEFSRRLRPFPRPTPVRNRVREVVR